MADIEGQESKKSRMGRPPKDPWGQSRADSMETAELFAELPTGFTIKVYRKSPEWASGYLGELFKSDESPLSVEELKNRFGGQILVIQVLDDSNKFRSQKTIKINDVPKVDYKEVNPSFAQTGILHKMNSNGTSSHAAPGTQGAFPNMFGMGQPGQNGQMGFPAIPQGLPPKLQRQVMAHYFGFSLPEETKKDDKTDLFEMQKQKMLFEMMNQSTVQQNSQLQASMEMQRDMMRMRKEWERDAEPKQTPMESMNSTIAMIREMKSMQGEFGSSNNPATDIASQAIPAVESLLGELISLKKVSLQAAAAQTVNSQPEVRELPARTTTHTVVENKSNTEDNELSLHELAATLGKRFKALPENEQQEIMNVFLAQQNTAKENEDSEENNTILFDNNKEVGHNEDIPPDDDILDEEDRELLTHGDVQSNTGAGS